MTQEESSILMLRVALILLAEARRRGDFGDEEALVARAAALADELSGGAPSPDPKRPLLKVNLEQPDRIGLSIAIGETSASVQSLGLDGILSGGGTTVGLRMVEVDLEDLSEEEQAEHERRRAEWKERMERRQRFTANSYLRTVAAPPQPGADQTILAVALFADGFYVEHTQDRDPSAFEDHEAMMAAFLREDRGSGIQVEDDLDTDYFPSGDGGSGGVRVIRASNGFAPAPPAEARVLRITTDSGTVELDLTR